MSRRTLHASCENLLNLDLGSTQTNSITTRSGSMGVISCHLQHCNNDIRSNEKVQSTQQFHLNPSTHAFLAEPPAPTSFTGRLLISSQPHGSKDTRKPHQTQELAPPMRYAMHPNQVQFQGDISSHFISPFFHMAAMTSPIVWTDAAMNPAVSF
jgi:hypothetical protein